MTEQPSTKSFFSEWLEKLQQESWQLELLISGLALYGVIEMRPFIYDLHNYHVLNTSGFTSALAKFGVLLAHSGWMIFVINLLIHIILRGLWIGTIGLRYVSKEIEYDELNYSPKFTQYLKVAVGDYDDFIEKLEKFCSVLFAYTFLLFLFFISFNVYLLIGLSFFFLAASYGMAQIGPFMCFILTGLAFWLLGVLVFIDFITLGVFKKIEDETFSKIYFHIYRFYSIITLSFLYRPILYNFIDNHYTRRFFFASIIYIIGILSFNNLFTNDNYPHFPDFNYGMTTGEVVNDNCYDDLRNRQLQYNEGVERKVLPPISIDQYINTKSHMTFFLRMLKSDQDLLMKNSNVDPFRKAGLRFGLFGGMAFDDSVVDSLERNRESEVILILNQQVELLKNAIRADIQGQKTPELTHYLDSMDVIKNEINIKYKDLKQTYNNGKLGRIKNKFLSHIDLYLDSILINDKIDCQFYIHPNLNEKGLLCMHDLRQYSEGLHKLAVERKEYRSVNFKDSTLTRKIILPFYKKTMNE